MGAVSPLQIAFQGLLRLPISTPRYHAGPGALEESQRGYGASSARRSTVRIHAGTVRPKISHQDRIDTSVHEDQV